VGATTLDAHRYFCEGAECGDGVPGVAIAPVVEFTAGAGGGSSAVRRRTDGVDTRSNNGGQQGQAATREHPCGASVMQTVTDARHRPRLAYVIEVYRLAQAKEAFLEWWGRELTQSTHGYRMWQEYCVENSYEPSDMAGFPNTVMVVADFIASLQVINTPLYLIKEALTAIKGLFEVAK
jgi:hypothetical protein